MRTVALFGGSFNPPHVAHQLVALYALETQAIDELWWVPVFSHPFAKTLAPYDDRIAMCELAARALGSRVHVSRAEQELAARPGFVTSHTLDLVEHLAAAHADTRFRLLVGADILGQAANWHRWDDVVARAPLIVIGRAGHALPPGSHATDLVMPQIASTMIRELLAQNAQARADRDPGLGADVATRLAQLLPGEVLRYIAAHALYEDETP